MKSTMLFLVQLVSQTMTHLLRSEIDAKASRDKYDALNDKVDQLMASRTQVKQKQKQSQVSPIQPARQDSLGTSRLYLHDHSSTALHDSEGNATPLPNNRQFTDSFIANRTIDSASDDDSGSELEESFEYSSEQTSILPQDLMTGTSASDWIFSSPISHRTSAKYDARNGSF